MDELRKYNYRGTALCLTPAVLTSWQDGHLGRALLTFLLGRLSRGGCGGGGRGSGGRLGGGGGCGYLRSMVRSDSLVTDRVLDSSRMSKVPLDCSQSRQGTTWSATPSCMAKATFSSAWGGQTGEGG